jgi:hypothetical protein
LLKEVEVNYFPHVVILQVLKVLHLGERHRVEFETTSNQILPKRSAVHSGKLAKEVLGLDAWQADDFDDFLIAKPGQHKLCVVARVEKVL